MGFNALIHSHRPDLVDYQSLNPQQPIENLNNAFKIAHEDLGIASILDAEGNSISLRYLWENLHC